MHPRVVRPAQTPPHQLEEVDRELGLVARRVVGVGVEPHVVAEGAPVAPVFNSVLPVVRDLPQVAGGGLLSGLARELGAGQKRGHRRGQRRGREAARVLPAVERRDRAADQKAAQRGANESRIGV